MRSQTVQSSGSQSLVAHVQRPPRFLPQRRRVAVAVTMLVGLIWALVQPSAQAQGGWQWYKADLHIHSVLSADAYPDLGILSQKAKAAGYNVLFLTDHNLASSFPISNLTANHMAFEDSYTRWTSGTYGSLSSSTNTLVSSPVKSGTKSLHLQSSSSTTGETFIWAERGPNFRSGDIILKVSIYPTRIDAGSGVYISASIGGDPRVTNSNNPAGYTTQGGTISPGKNIVMVWQLGAARTPSTDPSARVLTYSLGSYTLNTWNNYTINVSQALADIPSADLPLDYNAVTYLKMATAANGGTADAYFDAYAIDASAPKTAGEEFVYRNSVIHTYDTSTFKIYPSVEMGVAKHAQRFNFGITDPSQFVSYYNGVDGILPTQQTGYPGQLNHPGSSGGVTAQEALNNHGYGADQVEANNQTHIDIWDGLLNQGSQILGVGSTDKHTASYTSSSGSTSIYAPTLDFDTLIHSVFEGRTFVNGGSFTGSVGFNLDSASQEPYPARYPVYVPGTQATANVHLAIPAGLSNGYTVKWISNGAVIATDSVTGSSYNATKSVSLSGPWTYVRAEVRSSGNSVRALTQPIFFIDVPGLPAGKSYHVDGVPTADARGYTKVFTKGITASNWDSTNQVLSLTFVNPADALVRLLMSTSAGPGQITVDGAVIPVADSLAAFDSATGSIWYYDSAAARLYLNVHHSSSTANVLVNFSGQTSDVTPPAKPTGLTATAVAPNQVSLSWTASTDNIGVAGYQVFRDNVKIATSSATSYLDTGLSPNTVHSYYVVAYDAANNLSPASDSVSATTPADTTAPSAPANLTATAASNTRVDLVWTASTDNIGVTGYQIFRNGAQIATAASTSYADTTVLANTTYTYSIRAVDAAGNVSDWSNTAIVTTPAITVLTFTPTADTYVRADSPTGIFGSATTLQVDNSPVKDILLKFSVSGVGARNVLSAKLRVYCLDAAPAGGDFHRVADTTWSEASVNWNNAPPADAAVVASLGSVSSGAWYEVDVTSLITGDGTVSLRMTSPSSNGADYSSKEGTAGFAPQLVVSVQ